MMLLLLPRLPFSPLNTLQPQMQRCFGNNMRADRGGDEEEKCDEQFVQADAIAIRAEKDYRADNHPTHPQGGGFGGAVQAHVKVR